jgi:hypothetical protein
VYTHFAVQCTTKWPQTLAHPHIKFTPGFFCFFEEGWGQEEDGVRWGGKHLNKNKINLGIYIAPTEPFRAALGVESRVCYLGNTADRQTQ